MGLTHRSRSRGPRRSHFVGEAGYVVPLTAILILPLMAFAALAVDVASWYADGQELQRAADAAATAAVAHLPNEVAAEAEALAAARRNGVDHTDPDIEVYVEPTGDLEVRVTIIDRDVERFFSSIILDDMTLARTAVAKYVPRIPFGSDDNTFGDQLAEGCIDLEQAGCEPVVGFFPAVNGRYERHDNGDPYSTYCLGNDGAPPCSDGVNYDYRANGYLYAVDVPQAAVDSGATITVEIYDPLYYFADQGLTNRFYDGFDSNDPMHTKFTLFDADGSDVGISTTTEVPGCARVYEDGHGSGGASNVSNWHLRWEVHCTFTAGQADVYPFRVQSSGFPGANETADGVNSFSLRVTSSDGNHPRLYALGDMGIMSTHDAGLADGTATFKLAEIADDYAGKAMTLSLFDAGDMNGNGTATIIPRSPTGGVSSCMYRSWQVGGSFSGWTTVSPCRITTYSNGTRYFNDLWLDVRIPIASDYSCSTDCWWEIEYQVTGNASFTERTTWTTTIDGDPLRLIE